MADDQTEEHTETGEEAAVDTDTELSSEEIAALAEGGDEVYAAIACSTPMLEFSLEVTGVDDPEAMFERLWTNRRAELVEDIENGELDPTAAFN